MPEACKITNKYFSIFLLTKKIKIKNWAGSGPTILGWA
jgi:hypothetical protein